MQSKGQKYLGFFVNRYVCLGFLDYSDDDLLSFVENKFLHNFEKM